MKGVWMTKCDGRLLEENVDYWALLQSCCTLNVRFHTSSCEQPPRERSSRTS